MNKIITGIIGTFLTLGVTLPALAGNIIYTSQKAGYTITFPGTWKLTPTKGIIDVLMVSPFDSKTDIYKENVSVAVEPTTINNSVKYFEDNKIAMSKSLKNFKKVGEGVTIIDKKPAYWMIFTENINGMTLQLKSYFFYRNGKGYVISCASTPKDYVKYSFPFIKIVDTMKF